DKPSSLALRVNALYYTLRSRGEITCTTVLGSRMIHGAGSSATQKTEAGPKPTLARTPQPKYAGRQITLTASPTPATAAPPLPWERRLSYAPHPAAVAPRGWSKIELASQS